MKRKGSQNKLMSVNTETFRDRSRVCGHRKSEQFGMFWPIGDSLRKEKNRQGRVCVPNVVLTLVSVSANARSFDIGPCSESVPAVLVDGSETGCCA